jgi:hypothetical protein
MEELLDAVFPVWSTPSLYSEDHRGKLISQGSESAVSSRELQVSSESSWLVVWNLQC